MLSFQLLPQDFVMGGHPPPLVNIQSKPVFSCPEQLYRLPCPLVGWSVRPYPCWNFDNSSPLLTFPDLGLTLLTLDWPCWPFIDLADLGLTLDWPWTDLRLTLLTFDRHCWFLTDFSVCGLALLTLDWPWTDLADLVLTLLTLDWPWIYFSDHWLTLLTLGWSSWPRTNLEDLGLTQLPWTDLADFGQNLSLCWLVGLSLDLLKMWP